MQHTSKPAPDVPKWSALLVEAVNKPGLIMEAYSAFHNYSIGNQFLALVQCQLRGLEPGPINTFPGWQALGFLCSDLSLPWRRTTDQTDESFIVKEEADLKNGGSSSSIIGVPKASRPLQRNQLDCGWDLIGIFVSFLEMGFQYIGKRGRQRQTKLGQQQRLQQARELFCPLKERSGSARYKVHRPVSQSKEGHGW